MKNFILSLFVFMMCVPGLACANCFDCQKPAAAKEMPCCPKDTGTVLKACANMAVQQADNTPVFKQVPIAFAVVYLHTLLNTAPVVTNTPPPERLSAAETHPPILLQSPRLRI